MLKFYDRAEQILGRILRAIASAFLAALVLLLAFNILNRRLGWVTMAWYEEIVTLCFGWMVFLGAAELWRMRAHFNVDFLLNKLRGVRSRSAVQIVLDAVSALFFLLALVYGIRWIGSIRSTTPALKLPTGVQYAAIPVSMALMLVMTLRDIAQGIRNVFGSK